MAGGARAGRRRQGLRVPAAEQGGRGPQSSGEMTVANVEALARRSPRHAGRSYASTLAPKRSRAKQRGGHQPQSRTGAFFLDRQRADIVRHCKELLLRGEIRFAEGRPEFV